MRYLSPNTSEAASISSRVGMGSDSSFYARVVRVITKTTDPGFDDNGGLKSINGIFCSNIENTTGQSDSEESNVVFAYQGDLNFLHIPIVGEIVRVYLGPSIELDSITLSSTFYYNRVVNMWNHPKDSLLYDVYKPINVLEDHEQFNVNPTTYKQGDTIMQGRYGQIIKYTLDETTKKPKVYIASGKPYIEPSFTMVEEDVNKDHNPIELISDGTTDIKSSNTFTKSHRKDQIPENTKTYSGEQTIVNSGRVVINSKEDSILIASKKSIAISANTINQEATKEMCFEAPKIYLGEKAMNSTTPEPILLGNKIEEYLSEILDELIEISDSLASAVTVAGQQLPTLNQKGAKTSIVLRSLKSRLNPKGPSEYKSKKTFVA